MIGGVVYPFVKVLVSGNVVEIWRFSDRPNFPPERDDDETREKVPCDSVAERQRNQRRSKWNFMRTVNCTFDRGSKFITFTFRDGILDDVTDVREANVFWNSFIKRMRRRYGSFEWAVVVEFQDSNGRGAVHYHMIANLPYIPQDELESIWEAGYVWINEIDHVDNVGAYVVKYMAADMDDMRLAGLKAWRTSRNVKKPLLLRGDEARDFLSRLDTPMMPLRIQSQYASEYSGLILYEQYNLG